MALLKITCLGGVGEIGMNLYLYETDTTAIIVDYGVMFEDTDKYGVDAIYPDTAYLKQISSKLKAIVLTHGHEDHIGGLINLEMPELPIYTGTYTSFLIEHKYESKLLINTVYAGEECLIGDLKLRFIPVAHSIPDTFGVIISHNGFNCFHLSDFRVDTRQPIELKEKVDCLLMDSTNAEDRSFIHFTETDIKYELEKIFNKTKGRIFFTTFSSNIVRLASAVTIARKVGRSVVIEGAAMEKAFKIASNIGLISDLSDILITAKKAYNEMPSKLLYILSGCQGEVTGALYSVATGERKAIKVESGDLLIMSSRNIPSNGGNINKMINSIMMQGANVIEAKDKLIHVSGHANSQGLVSVLNRIKPRYLVPIHGEYRHISALSRLAQKERMPSNNILFMLAGDQLWFDNGEFVGKTKVESGKIYFDNRGGYTLSEEEVSVRKQIARDGLVIIRIRDDVGIETHGFTLHDFQLKELKEDLANATINAELDKDEKSMFKRVTKRYFRKMCSRRPHIVIQ